MILDTSAVFAVLADEPERRAFHLAIEAAPACRLSAASFLETSIVVEVRYGADGVAALDLWIQKAGVEVVVVDRHQAEVAREAFRRFGKGRHRAGLNFGDCFAYALARTRGEPLLFKGEDFRATDVQAALP